ncbi:MAG TPA: hypothetical protein VGO47_03365, partial [Chlamydiales bacterium]|jgi:hypothetical protein|nr:hypothetical protein [Chlamydiales bacterium]
MLVAIFSGVYAMFKSDDPKSWFNFAYAMTSVGAHASAIPAGLVAACLSLESVGKGFVAIKSLDENDAKAFAKRQVESWAAAAGIDPAFLA